MNRTTYAHALYCQLETRVSLKSTCLGVLVQKAPFQFGKIEDATAAVEGAKCKEDDQCPPDTSQPKPISTDPCEAAQNQGQCYCHDPAVNKGTCFISVTQSCVLKLVGQGFTGFTFIRLTMAMKLLIDLIMCMITISAWHLQRSKSRPAARDR